MINAVAGVFGAHSNGDSGKVVPYFLSHSNMMMACDLSRYVFSELPWILLVYFKYSISIMVCVSSCELSSTLLVVLPISPRLVVSPSPPSRIKRLRAL